jgi:uracil phosphoribosyltransferase
VTTPIDSQFRSLPLPSRGVEHCYGERVCLHSFPYPVSLLTRLSSPETTQPLFNLLLTELYQFLVGKVASLELAQVHVEQPTRMQPINPEGIIRGSIIDPHQKVIVVDVARAGIMPAQIFFDRLCTLLDAGAVRQDHIFMQRVANERGEVTGVDLSGSKIGGPVNERLVIIPDPMGATGSSMIRTRALRGSPHALRLRQPHRDPAVRQAPGQRGAGRDHPRGPARPRSLPPGGPGSRTR